MKVTRYLSATAVVAVFIALWGWLFHDVILHAMYGAMDYAWMRPISEVHTMYAWVILGLLLFSLFFVFLFTQFSKDGGIKPGMRYGFWIGALFSATMLTWYVMVPITLTLTIWWIVGGLIELTIAGVIAGAIYRK